MTSIVGSELVDRWASFVTYPSTLLPTPHQLCVSGFTSKQNPDIPSHVHCIHCGIQFYGFKPNENAYRKHCEYSPTCPWVVTIKERLASRASITSTEAAMTTPSEYARSTPKAVTAGLTPPATPPPPSEPTLVLTPPVTSSKTASNTSLPMTPPTSPVTTPRKQISWAEIASRPVVAPKPSRLPIPTPKPTPECTETAPFTCPPTPSPIPPPKPYMTIDDLYEMFDGKHKRMDLLHSNNKAKKQASSPCVSRQAKITSYFRPAANQSKPISQGSKTPNPRSFRQLMPAESIRARSSPHTETMPEKSAVSPYKRPSISEGIPFTPAPYPYKGHALNGGPNFCSQWIRPQQVSQSEAVHYQGCGDSMHGSEAKLFAGWYVGRKASKTTPIHAAAAFEPSAPITTCMGTSAAPIWSTAAAAPPNEPPGSTPGSALEEGLGSISGPGAIHGDIWANGRRNRPFPYFFTCITNRFLMDGSHVPATRHNEGVVVFFRWWHLLR
ncbi:hypothetical protein G7Y79_00003g011160 [Physcia stellaris]|nr:hypothetical protein G7Y79_00003g011160 [Physcia stellaris]